MKEINFHAVKKTKYCMAQPARNKAVTKFSITEITKQVESSIRKINLEKGFALMPICFGISFTNTMLNSGKCVGTFIRWKYWN
jgi:xanthine dehydrogenase large subunit